jgi:hypothetical protein
MPWLASCDIVTFNDSVVLVLIWSREALMKRLLCFAVALLSVGSSATAPSIPEIRLTPTAVMSGDKGDNQIGSSKLAGVHTKVLAGNPAATGFYSILLFVPAHTTIQRTLIVTIAWRRSSPGIGSLAMVRILTKAL